MNSGRGRERVHADGSRAVFAASGLNDVLQWTPLLAKNQRTHR